MVVSKKNCEKCGRLVSFQNYSKHLKACGYEKVQFHLSDTWKFGDKYECPYCKKVYSKNGIATHIWRNHGSGINHNPFKNRNPWNKGKEGKTGWVPWNKGLTKETDERVRKTGETYSIGMKNGTITPSFLNKHHSEKTKKLLSEIFSKNNKGGRCKWFDYIKKDGSIVKLQGTWEVRFAKVLDVIDENWIKPGAGNKKYSFWWKDKEEEKHCYTPDFYSPKLNKYFEVKGYWWGDDKEKMKQVLEQIEDTNIQIIMKKELENYENLIGE